MRSARDVSGARRGLLLVAGLGHRSAEHYDQPLWTLVGAGVVPKEEFVRAERDLIPASDEIVLANGERVGYDSLIVACGLVCNWEEIDGLVDALGHDGVVSNYDYDECERTWQQIQGFSGGNAVFTMPPPIKCAGAPQKIMYLACRCSTSANAPSGTRDTSPAPCSAPTTTSPTSPRDWTSLTRSRSSAARDIAPPPARASSSAPAPGRSSTSWTAACLGGAGKAGR